MIFQERRNLISWGPVRLNDGSSFLSKCDQGFFNA
jgi:hypothetical protein